MESVRGRLVDVAAISMVSAMLAGLLLVVMSPMPARASCATEPADTIADQETVFLATATEQTERHVRVEVEEIWRGPDLAPTVWLQTSAAELPPWPVRLVVRVATSVDADLVPGTRYVIATVDGGSRTNTRLVAETSEELVDRLAPEATRQPIDSGVIGQGPGILEGITGTALAVASITALPAGGWLAHRRFRAARRADRDVPVMRRGTGS